jgi:hypothetical protein
MNSQTKAGKKNRLGPDDRKQSKLFMQKAREIEADEEQSAADELLGQLAKKPPEPRKPKDK